MYPDIHSNRCISDGLWIDRGSTTLMTAGGTPLLIVKERHQDSRLEYVIYIGQTLTEGVKSTQNSPFIFHQSSNDITVWGPRQPVDNVGFPRHIVAHTCHGWKEPKAIAGDQLSHSLVCMGMLSQRLKQCRGNERVHICSFTDVIAHCQPLRSHLVVEARWNDTYGSGKA